MRCTFYSTLAVAAIFAAESSTVVRAIAIGEADYDYAQLAAQNAWID